MSGRRMGRGHRPRKMHLPEGAQWIQWHVAGETYACAVLPDACGKCGKRTLVELPPPIAKIQTDGTTHVCHPSFHGCNQGYAHELPPKAKPTAKAALP